MAANKKRKILIVDDELFLARAIKERLMLEGFDIVVAADGLAGLDAADNFTPDLILLDLLMPKMDGIAMLQKIRQKPEHKRTPVIVLSNLNNAKSIDESLAAGAQKFMVKVNSSLDDVVFAVKDFISPKR